jgi:hypothetical protein
MFHVQHCVNSVRIPQLARLYDASVLIQPAASSGEHSPTRLLSVICFSEHRVQNKSSNHPNVISFVDPLSFHTALQESLELIELKD